MKCGMHNVKGAGLATICPTTVGSEAGNLPTENFLFSSSTVEIPAAPAASMLTLFSSSFLLFFFFFFWGLSVAASSRSSLGVVTTKKKPECPTEFW